MRRRGAMLSSYFTIARRTLARSKTYAFINITGLSVGMACWMLILLYVLHESNYDGYHPHADRIYRVEVAHWATAPMAIGPYMKEHFPETEGSVRFLRVTRASVGRENEFFSEKRFFFADSTAPAVLSIPLLLGDPAKALAPPSSVILTRAMAAKYFGPENPVGKTLRVETGRSYLFTVTGVAENVPDQSQFKFDFLGSYSTLTPLPENDRRPWVQSTTYTYVFLRPRADVQTLERNITAVFNQRLGGEDSASIQLRPIREIHTHSDCEKETEPLGSIREIYILLSIAFLVLALAVINFVNLSTARSLKRAREVAMRKTLGAGRGALIGQFIGESTLLAIFSAIIAVVLCETLLPSFSALTAVPVSYYRSMWMILAGSSLILAPVVGIISGAYPALYLSRFHPAGLLRSGGGGEDPAMGSALVRKALVVFQFTISAALTTGALLITRQLDFIQSKDIGIASQQVVVMPVSAIPADRYGVLKDELLRNSAVRSVTASFSVPGERIVMDVIHPANAREKEYGIRMILADFDFSETYGLALTGGRSFSRELVSDTGGAFLINEKAAALFGWDSPVGRTVEYPGQQKSGQIVGIMRDFNFASLHAPVEPLVVSLCVNTQYYKNIAVRITTQDRHRTLDAIEKTWKAVLPGRPFEYYFLDESFRSLYQSEAKLRTIVATFTLVGIVVACIGLFGLVTLAVEKRTKEIGIRKVLGASVGGIVGLISGDFLKLVILANLIAWPIAYFGMNAWLQDFAYRTDVSPWIFAITGATTLVLAFLTLAVQAIRAALSNPVDALRYE
jgi:putative ABC transport system permease protein